MPFFDAFEAAIFDLDGTLIDSMPLWENFCGNWLKSLNKIPGPTLEADIVSMTINESVEYVKRHYELDLSPEELIVQWENAMTPIYLKKAPLKKGVKELMQALAFKGIKLGIATYSFPRCTKEILIHHGIYSYFSMILHGHEFGQITGIASVKKVPGFWCAAAERLNTAPEKCIVFEDSSSSLQGARAAGMGFAAVYDSSWGDWTEFSKAADLALNYPGEALLII